MNIKLLVLFCLLSNLAVASQQSIPLKEVDKETGFIKGVSSPVNDVLYTSYINNKTILSGGKVSYVGDFSSHNSDFSGKSLRYLYYRNSIFTGCGFTSANLMGGIFENVDFSNSDFSGAFLSKVTFKNCNFTNVIFKNINFIGCLFTENKINDLSIDDCDFAANIFISTTFDNVEFNNVDFFRAQIIDCVFSKIKFNSCQFSMVLYLSDFCVQNSTFDDCTLCLEFFTSTAQRRLTTNTFHNSKIKNTFISDGKEVVILGSDKFSNLNFIGIKVINNTTMKPDALVYSYNRSDPYINPHLRDPFFYSGIKEVIPKPESYLVIGKFFDLN
jgi:uncharacterized protein YjbI with pentapeptide repeats